MLVYQAQIDYVIGLMIADALTPCQKYAHSNNSPIKVGGIYLKKESLLCLTTPLEHIDFQIIGYWTSSIWSL